MEIITSKYQVFCDTFDTIAEAKMHETKGKRKLQLTLSNNDSAKNLSLWKEDVILFADFLKSISENLDSRLK